MTVLGRSVRRCAAGILWDQFVIFHYHFTVPVLAAGATPPARLEVGFDAALPVEALTVGDVGFIEPSITPSVM